MKRGGPPFGPLHCERPTHAALRLYDLPQWDGGDLSGELLLLLDGGPGDVFMMTRWVSSVQARTQGLTLVGSPSLMDFCAGQFPNASVVSRGTLDSWLRTPGQASLDSFAAWAHSFALPDLLGISHPDGVRSAPYLRAPPEPFRPLDGLLRVGIRWAGWRHHAHDLVRSTRLTDWEPVLQVPGVRFFSLQLDEPTELCAFADRVEDLAPELVTWDRTAAAMMQLDLVISVDTSVAHLAGALGRPVWICLSADPEWRWMLERTDTPWYGSARLFRQDRVGNWVSVFEAVAAELRGLARDRQPLCA